MSLLHVDRDGLGRNTIRHHDQVTDAQLLIGWHIEMSGHEPPKRNGHAAVVVRPAVKNVSGCPVGDVHQRVIRGGVVIVSIGSPLREPIELMARNDVRLPWAYRAGGFLDRTSSTVSDFALRPRVLVTYLHLIQHAVAPEKEFQTRPRGRVVHFLWRFEGEGLAIARR